MSLSSESRANNELTLYILWAYARVRADVRCKNCGARKYLCLHHRSYENATIQNVDVLCEGCHKRAHGKEPKKERPINTFYSTINPDGTKTCHVRGYQFNY